MGGRSQHSPTNGARLLRRALRAHGDGEGAKAERLYNAALERDPQNFEALHGLGRLHLQRGRLDTALVLLQSALKADMNRAEGFADLGLVFHLLRRFKDALTSYDAGLAIDANNAELLNRRGVALLELNRPADALPCFERAVALDAANFEALGNYGNSLVKLNRPADALAAYDRALALQPDNAALLTNRAAVLRRLDRVQESLMSARRALVADPSFAQARFVEAMTQLTLGDFAAGWRGYEARWSTGFLAAQRRNFAAPLWLGQETPDLRLDGKTILLYAEQGYGDALQFVRYAPLVAGQGAGKVILEVRKDLVPLLRELPGVTDVVAHGAPLPRFDLHCPLLSLPLAFATRPETIPADVPYLAAPAGRIALWRDRLPPTRPLVGLAWSGERTHDNDLNRSLAFEALAPLLTSSNATFVSLQHDLREADAAAAAQCQNLVHLEPFADFADTAAVTSMLDAVISVDTAIAHLAGALGKPLLLLLPFAADFRWLRERTDSPWYPTARLYRQPGLGDWQTVIANVAGDVSRVAVSPGARKLSA